MLSEQDQQLLTEARRIIELRQRPDWHQVGCAMRTRSGRMFSAVHLEAYVGRIAVCTEAIAIGMGAAEGDTDIETIVAVNRRGEVVSPCGMCRELITDYSSSAQVILSHPEGLRLVRIQELLPAKYARTDSQPLEST